MPLFDPNTGEPIQGGSADADPSEENMEQETLAEQAGTEVSASAEELAPQFVKPHNKGGRKETLPGFLQAVEDRANPTGFLQEKNPLEELLKSGDEKYGIDMRTELTDVQVIQFSRGRIMADHFGIPLLAEWIEHIERMLVSKKREGRKEFVEAFKASMNAGGGTNVNIGDAMAEKLRG